MIATLGFDNLAIVGVTIDLGLASTATAGGYRFSLGGAGLRIQDRDDVLQGFSVFGHQAAQFVFESHLMLQGFVVLQGIKLSQLLLQGFFESAVFSEFGHKFPRSEMLGRDLRKSSMRAYHDGGMYADQAYDDDQGGPLYVAGDEGVELEPISSAEEAEAKKQAAELFRSIGSKGAFGMMDSTTGSFV